MEAIGYVILGAAIIIIGLLIIILMAYKNMIQTIYWASLDLNNPEDFREASIHLYGPIIKEFKNVTLFVVKGPGSEKKMIWDTSMYESRKLIGLTLIDPECNEASYNFVPNQIVNLHEEGVCTWLKT